jgi:hypothetical protein
MKKTFIYIAMIAISGTILTSCGGSKNLANQPNATEQRQPTTTTVDPVEEEIRRMEQEARLIQARTALQLAEREAELRLAQQHQVNVTLVWTPCNQQSLVASGGKTNFLTGLGVADQQRNREDALLNANMVAVLEIASRLVGVITTGVERYGSQGTTQSGMRIDQAEREGLLRNIGTQAVNRIGHPVCREVAIDNNTGMWVGFVAIHVPLDDVINEVQLEMERADIRVNRNRFAEHVKNELQGQEEQRQREMQALEDARNR